MQRARDAWVLVIMVLIVALGAAYQGRERQATESFRTSEDTGPAGHKALFLLCRQQGLPVARMTDPLVALARASAIVLVEPFRRPLGPGEVDRLVAWVRAGGLVVYVPAVSATRGRPGSTSPVDAVRPVPSLSNPTDRSYATTYQRDVPYLSATSDEHLAVSRGRPWRTIAGSKDRAYAVEQRIGDGRWITVSAGIWPSNESIGQVNNATFVLNILQSASPGRGAIWFDEYHHRFPDSDAATMSLWTAIGPPGRMAALAMAVLVLALVYNGNRRLGRPIDGAPQQPRGVSDHLRAMALLYRRAGAGAVALRAPFGRVVAAAADRAGLPRSADLEVIAAGVAKATPNAASELKAIAGALERSQRPAQLSDREAIDLMKRMDALVEALSD